MTTIDPPGTLLVERYRIEEVLRRAAATTTYGAVVTSTGQRVVIKELRVGELGAWKEYDLFEREIETLRSLDHPGLPRLVDHHRIEAPGDVRVLLVMTRMPGVPLDRRITSGQPLEAALARRVLEGLLGILAYLHGQMPAVVHRDLKPSNLLLDGDRVFLVDFGGVRRYLPWARDGSTMVGTFGYLAPEQLHGEATPASDIYSLGATMAALLEGRDAPELPRQGLRVDLASLTRIPPSLREVLGAMLEPDPGDRLGSVSAVRQALAAGQIVGGGGGGGGLKLPGYWLFRRLARYGLGAFSAGLFLAALMMELLKAVSSASIFGDLAMGFSMASLAMLATALLVRTRAGYQKKLLRLARKQGGRVHKSEVVERLGLAPERAEELLEELVASGMARRDARQPGEYQVGPERPAGGRLR